MKMLRSLVAAGLSLIATACVYPTSATVQGGATSALSFASLPATAIVAVDGVMIGKAGDYATKVLAVAPGTHRVSVQNAGQTIVDREFYVGRDSTVKVAQ